MSSNRNRLNTRLAHSHWFTFHCHVYSQNVALELWWFGVIHCLYNAAVFCRVKEDRDAWRIPVSDSQCAQFIQFWSCPTPMIRSQPLMCSVCHLPVHVPVESRARLVTIVQQTATLRFASIIYFVQTYQQQHCAVTHYYSSVYLLAYSWWHVLIYDQLYNVFVSMLYGDLQWVSEMSLNVYIGWYHHHHAVMVQVFVYIRGGRARRMIVGC